MLAWIFLFFCFCFCFVCLFVFLIVIIIPNFRTCACFPIASVPKVASTAVWANSIGALCAYVTHWKRSGAFVNVWKSKNKAKSKENREEVVDTRLRKWRFCYDFSYIHQLVLIINEFICKHGWLLLFFWIELSLFRTILNFCVCLGSPYT